MRKLRIGACAILLSLTGCDCDKPHGTALHAQASCCVGSAKAAFAPQTTNAPPQTIQQP